MTFADMFPAMSGVLGQTVTVWAPNSTIGGTAGINDAAWVDSGTATAIINELTPADADRLLGGPSGVRLATLYIGATDGASLAIGYLVVAANGNVWRVAGAPSQPDGATSHFEARLEHEPNPPAEVMPT